MTHRYNLKELPAWEPIRRTADASATPSNGLPRWGAENFATPPAIGERVNVRINGMGNGVVVGYFIEYGYLGIEVMLDTQPAWRVKQIANAAATPALVFGVEVQPAMPLPVSR